VGLLFGIWWEWGLYSLPKNTTRMERGTDRLQGPIDPVYELYRPPCTFSRMELHVTSTGQETSWISIPPIESEVFHIKNLEKTTPNNGE
jgi:hypothetical protein